MKAFIERLTDRNEKDSRVRAVLRRSLAFEPGTFAPAFPYVEPFLNESDSAWRRKVFYLVAGLWAEHWKPGRTGPPLRIGSACARYQLESKSANIERRLITLLDSDNDQLPYRLRQMIALLKDEPIDFEDLIKGLLYWGDDQKRTQNAWAREFYRKVENEKEPEPITQEGA